MTPTIESLFQWFEKRAAIRASGWGDLAEPQNFNIFCERYTRGGGQVQFAETEFNVRVEGDTLLEALVRARTVIEEFDATGRWSQEPYVSGNEGTAEKSAE